MRDQKIGIRDTNKFREWTDSTSNIIDYNRWIEYLEQQILLFSVQYYGARTINEQLTILNITEEACSYVRAQIQEDDETSLFPIDPIIRYIRSYTRERWYESLEVLLKNQLSLSSTIGYCQFPGRTIPYSDPIGSETWISWIFQGSS
ncbi:unnamed protein product [Adineta ricciae]|uniref:Uncharacterized protein n=1 Tax=Adineta ricciae TaxID=249248 RepID=A0A814ZTT8_ADIRI|nr:unnamed protein product [Adineta ricciae]